MTAREARNARRAAERRSAKLARKAGLSPEPAATEQSLHPAPPSDFDRATINRSNASHSTGPRTPEGKARSSRNAFKHGLYSSQLVLPNEDPAELDALRVALRSEHQPVNTTEEILVNELAENFWRMRRMRGFEAVALDPENLDRVFDNGTYVILQRAMASAERAFHKSLATLRQLQKDRGFVPHLVQAGPHQAASAPGETALSAKQPASPVTQTASHATHSGFVFADLRQEHAATSRFVPENNCGDLETPGETLSQCSEAA